MQENFANCMFCDSFWWHFHMQKIVKFLPIFFQILGRVDHLVISLILGEGFFVLYRSAMTLHFSWFLKNIFICYLNTSRLSWQQVVLHGCNAC